MSRNTAIRPQLWLALLLWLGSAIADISDSLPSSDSGDSVDTSRWNCALCPYRFGWYGEIELGAGWVSDSSNKFGDYRGLNDKGGFAALDGEVHFRSRSGRFFDVIANDLGIDSRRIEARSGERGRYTIALGYREIPKYRGFGAESPYLGSGGGVLTLPAGWQAAPTTSAMSGLAQALQAVELKTTRRIFDAALAWRLGRQWSWEVKYQHQSRDGTRPFGAGVFTINSSHFPAPVDFSTDRVEMGLNFDGERSHWRVGFMGSEFDNARESVTWQNPFTPLPGTEMLRASLAPDNQAYRFDLAGTWSPGSRLRLAASAAFGRMEQDEPLLPYSINPEFSNLPLPRLTADSRVDATTFDFSGRLTARISSSLDVAARLKHDERDNETPVDTWTPVITDLVERAPRPNRPYSFERDRASLSLRLRPRSGLGLQAGLKSEDYERTLQSVAETEESGWFAEASLSPGSKVAMRARIERTDRDGQPYLQVPDFSLPEHPLMRKFNLADRDRERLKLDLDFFPSPELMINLAYRQDEDRYRASILGLRESDSSSLSLDLNWSPAGRISAYAFISHDDFDSTMASMENGTAAPWVGTTDDTFITAGIGLTLNMGARTDLGFDLVSSEADGDIRTDSGAGEPPFPTLETDLLNTRLRLDYRGGERWGFRLLIEHESYDSTDWALDGLGPAGIPAILSFGAESPDYDVTVIRAQASYRF